MGFDKQMRPTGGQRRRHLEIVTSTAASTALVPKNVISLETTSTGAPVVYTLAGAPKKGDEFHVHATSVASSSVAPFHINAGSGVAFGSSSEDMLTLAVAGNGAHLIALSSARWAAVGGNGATFSTST